MANNHGFYPSDLHQQQQQPQHLPQPPMQSLQQCNNHSHYVRGRQNQVPKRYEFQKNIPRRTSSQQNQQLLLTRLGVEEAKLPRSPLHSIARGREASVGSHESQGSRGSHWSNPGLQRVRSSGPGASGKYTSQNLAQLKRHSIADMSNSSVSSSFNVMSGMHGLNIYNDSTVFETTAVGPRNYAFEQHLQQQKQNDYMDSIVQKKRLASIDIGNSGRYRTAVRNTEEQTDSPMPRFFRSPKFDGKTTDTVDNRSLSQYRETNAVSRDGEEAAFADAKVDNCVGSDDDVSIVDMDGIDESEEQPIGNEDGESEITLQSDPSLNYSYDDVAYTPTRTQQRKLAIKAELDGEADSGDNLPIGEGWMDPANYSGVSPHVSVSTTITTATVGPSLSTTAGKKDSTAVWMNSSLKQRNMYEHVTSELRKMVLFSEKPVVDSVARNRQVQASRAASGGATVGGGAAGRGRAFRREDIGALVAEMWQEARGRSLVG